MIECAEYPEYSVKADYLFSYQPPINLFALVIMLPSSYLLSPRWFHKVSVLVKSPQHCYSKLKTRVGKCVHDQVCPHSRIADALTGRQLSMGWFTD